MCWIHALFYLNLLTTLWETYLSSIFQMTAWSQRTFIALSRVTELWGPELFWNLVYSIPKPLLFSPYHISCLLPNLVLGLLWWHCQSHGHWTGEMLLCGAGLGLPHNFSWPQNWILTVLIRWHQYSLAYHTLSSIRRGRTVQLIC